MTSSGQRTVPLDYATVVWNGHRYIVVFREVEYAHFSNDEQKNAQDFANGFNAGLSRSVT